jgi:hypothetical protein
MEISLEGKPEPGTYTCRCYARRFLVVHGRQRAAPRGIHHPIPPPCHHGCRAYHTWIPDAWTRDPSDAEPSTSLRLNLHKAALGSACRWARLGLEPMNRRPTTQYCERRPHIPPMRLPPAAIASCRCGRCPRSPIGAATARPRTVESLRAAATLAKKGCWTGSRGSRVYRLIDPPWP